jgi:hypothetical protein
LCTVIIIIIIQLIVRQMPKSHLGPACRRHACVPPIGRDGARAPPPQPPSLPPLRVVL